ncbi:UDP-N-acetylmuramoylalanyl-D-glutamate--2,6-diaminopimelate ligase [Sinobaca qinghaiensis]|uniref:UDP-N-acetylmuramoyl-L-alanyl-D-glutamate--2,6-diaminopimelate ligase n=1 Tax=Sinobaca qinghaiensis TaxID=342944 RepID=A0A419V639_9BACL|nr:UDP-N-acetylmuramoyl-L-alanyl-D-glutamate--2,6-diaminopimelate ligase [Sinobaca qinghaiensis]RKD75452.1 UDP-N-acetylmuramoylalanyl-D-glutamate--2,6-diaminopimelate ligase [Sinobaca qinghaiensis]
MITLHDLLPPVLVHGALPTENPEITSIHMDSREVVSGGVFFCIEGYTVDGHEYAEQAVRNGACAVIAKYPLPLSVPVLVVRDTQKTMAIAASRFYQHPTGEMRLIGITGTNGKTTTSHLLEAVLKENAVQTGLIGTMYTKINEEIFETKNTTPESVTIQKIFRDMKDQDVDSCIMEVSSHALDLGRVRGCDFNTVVFTNLTKDHLDYHETMDKYRQAKSLLFSQLGNSYEGEEKTAVLNADDSASLFFEKVCPAPVLTYGIDEPADIRAENISMTPTGTSFTIVTPWGEESLSLSMAGKFSIYNALAAATAALSEGISLSTIVSALGKVKGVAGRFELVESEEEFAVIVDYAHTPDSLKNVLETAREMAAGSVYTVVGCGGNRDKTKRPEMAKIAVTLSDMSIFTADNPRDENPASIIDDMTIGLTNTNFKVIEDRREAIKYAIEHAEPGDLVLIAGKGHETYQIIKDEVFSFDDRKEAETAIKNKTHK